MAVYDSDTLPRITLSSNDGKSRLNMSISVFACVKINRRIDLCRCTYDSFRSKIPCRDCFWLRTLKMGKILGVN